MKIAHVCCRGRWGKIQRGNGVLWSYKARKKGHEVMKLLTLPQGLYRISSKSPMCWILSSHLFPAAINCLQNSSPRQTFLWKYPSLWNIDVVLPCWGWYEEWKVIYFSIHVQKQIMYYRGMLSCMHSCCKNVIYWKFWLA